MEICICIIIENICLSFPFFDIVEPFKKYIYILSDMFIYTENDTESHTNTQHINS